MPPPANLDEDINLLKEFVAQTYDWLRACYIGDTNSSSRTRLPVIAIRPSIATLAREAWEEFEKACPLGIFFAGIDNTKAKKLIRNGLFGKQLEYKLATIRHAAECVAKGLIGWKRKLLDLIDNLLDSILNVIGVGDSLKELKDALVDSLPDEV